MTILGLAPSKASTIDQGPQNGKQQTQHEMSEDAKKLAANALAAVKDAASVASGRGKVEVNLNCQHHTSFVVFYYRVMLNRGSQERL